MESNPARPCYCDASGRPIFGSGGAGPAHVLAHECLDTGRLDEGRRRLGDWLAIEDRSGGDRRLVHLHWHQLVFELDTGHRTRAWDRFTRRILPAILFDRALTDAPQALWRFELSSTMPSRRPWQVAAEAARRNLGHDDFRIELHNLLALAGAKDIEALDRWRAMSKHGSPELSMAAEGLRARAVGDHSRAQAQLAELALENLSSAGSRGQAELFTLIRRDSWVKSRRAA